MIKEIIFNKKYRDIRLIIFFSASVTMLLWIKNSLEISCLLSFIQNVLLVLFITNRILRRMNISEIQRIKNGLIIGGCIGIIYATMGILVEDIHYYFFGGRLQTSRDLGIPYFPLTIDLLTTGLIAQLWIWLLLVLVSVLCGFIAGVISRSRVMESKKAKMPSK